MNQLPIKCHEGNLMQMYLLKGLSLEEIAKKIDVPEATVRERIKIAKKLLQEILKQQGYL